MGQLEDILRILPLRFRERISREVVNPKMLEELRFRIGQPVYCRYGGVERCLMSSDPPTKQELELILGFASNYSVYAVEQELKQGYLTIVGGHRLGLCGQVRYIDGSEKHYVLRNISAINLRIAHEWKGKADEIYERLRMRQNPKSVLLLSPPGVGKTTLLRDLIRRLSMEGQTVGVVDERSELAACKEGVPQNDLGPRTDVLDGIHKEEGIRMLLRTMSPDYIAVDEITSEEEVEILRAFGCGVRILATSHAGSMEDLEQKPGIRSLLGNGIDAAVLLSRKHGPGTIEQIVEWGRGGTSRNAD